MLQMDLWHFYAVTQDENKYFIYPQSKTVLYSNQKSHKRILYSLYQTVHSENNDSTVNRCNK